MPQVHLLSAAEQVAAHLREEIASGIRSEIIPGVSRLAGELGVNHKTVEVAVRLLEKEGLLINQGPGRGRLINLSGQGLLRPGLRVAILLASPRDRGDDAVVELRHLLEEAGHLPFFPRKTMRDLDMDATRIGRFVKRTDADAWIVTAGSRGVLEWFSHQPIKTFALYGRRLNLPIAGAGPDKTSAIAEATRHLIESGHRRITFLIRRQHRLPDPGPSVRAYLDELEANDIQVGHFNLPDWEESKSGYQEILESLFQLTPPTAILTDEAYLFIAAQQFLAKHGLCAPKDVSLIAMEDDPSFAWCDPAVTHIRSEFSSAVQCALRWANNVSRGQTDIRQTTTKSEFIKGGTI